ncbi:MAG: SDR family oxidoreductase [Streptosporangiales bacterium]|nr:SDR family oxidoreductase [Streptosporangiales bacterium]
MSVGDEAAARRDSVLGRLYDVRGLGAVVTGAASGLGRAIAEVLAETGARVTLADADAEGLAKVAEEFAGQGLPVRTYEVDITDRDRARALMDDAVGAYGRLDVVFANAGIGGGPSYARPEGWVDRLPRERWDRVVDVNLNGTYHTLAAAAAVMRPRRHGKIILTASTAGLRADPMVSYAYVAAKAAVVNVARQAALELAPHGIHVNAIAPGPFRTNIGGARGRQPEAQAAWARTIPLGRMADPEEIKGLALLLASPASSFMTGAVYPIDGGALTLAHAL